MQFHETDGIVLTLAMVLSLDLDSMQTKPGIRNEVAVVIDPLTARLTVKSGRHFEEFAFEVHEKLRKAGFKQVIFAGENHGSYTRIWLGPVSAWEPTRREEALRKSYLTNRPPDPQNFAYREMWTSHLCALSVLMGFEAFTLSTRE